MSLLVASLCCLSLSPSLFIHSDFFNLRWSFCISQRCNFGYAGIIHFARFPLDWIFSSSGRTCSKTRTSLVVSAEFSSVLSAILINKGSYGNRMARLQDKLQRPLHHRVVR